MAKTPMSESATTRMPETAPPRSEMRSASARLCCAAAAVRRFDFTATNMPMMPDSIEALAPTRKAKPVRSASSSRLMPGTRSNA